MQSQSDGVKRQRRRVQGGWAAQPRPSLGLPEPRPNQKTLGQKQQQSYPSPISAPPTSKSSQNTCELTPRGATPQEALPTQMKMVSAVPRKFTWVEPGLLCGLAFPDRPQHIQYLVENNVHFLVNLTQDRSPPTHGFPDLKVIRISIRDFSPPTIDQVQQFLDIVQQAKEGKTAVAVHCNMGKGRTGTLLACFFIAHHNMAATDAIRHIKKLRPGSVQTSGQEATAVICSEDESVWATLCACFCVEFYKMSEAKAAAHVTSLLKTSPLSEEMLQTLQKYESVKSGIPHQFSWLVDGLLCGLSFPEKKEDLKYLVNNNVCYLVCLTREKDPDVQDFPDLVKVDLKLPDGMAAPDIEQIVEFLTLVDLAQAEKKAVAVHCSNGLHRTGTMLACYLVQKEALTAQEAIQKVRDLRPGSVGSRAQEVLIAEYETHRRKVPRRFSWVIKDCLCAMAFPGEPENMQYLVDHGVRYLVCLTEERDPDVQDFPGLRKVDIKMADFSCPTQDQLKKFLSVMDKAAQENKAVAIHCAGGRGRTGTMISCYLVQEKKLTASQALQRTRELRPGSVETSEQEQFIYNFEKSIRKMPDNFSWVVDDLLCTLAFPETRQNLQYLLDNNVSYLVSLTAEREPPIRLCPDLEMVSLKVQDFTPPTIQQVEEFLNILEKAEKKNKAVALHCSQGQGRTGTMIACYLVKTQKLSAVDAIEGTRWLIRGSIETKEQEKLVHDFVKYRQDKEQFDSVC